MDTDFDVLVAGSGLGGLSCASLLAKAGYSVGVFEKHRVAGGYATLFARKDYTFDVSLHGIGGLAEGGNTRRVLEQCGVWPKLQALRNPIAYSLLFRGQMIDIPNDLHHYTRLMISLFPMHAKGIERLLDGIARFERGFNAWTGYEEKSVIRRWMNKDFWLFVRWSQQTTEQVIRKYVDCDEFIRFFTTLWPYYGLPPSQLAALYFFIPWLSYHRYGKFYLQGGGQSISDALVKTIEGHGGIVRIKSEVTKICCEDQKDMVSVVLKNGDRYTARYLVSNMDPKKTFSILDKKLPTVYQRAIESMQVGCSLTQLYVGLDCSPSTIGILQDEIFYTSSDNPDEGYSLAQQGNYDRCDFSLTNYSSMDQSLNKPNYGVVTISVLDYYGQWSANKEEYTKQKQAFIRLLLDRVEVLYPGFQQHIAVMELGTPRTMERYTGNYQGAVYGYAQTVKQAGKNRIKNKTPIPQLFLTGAWTQPGGGYEGCLTGGFLLAQQLKKKLKREG